MFWYRPAGQDYYFSCPVPELEPFEITGTENGTADEAVPFVPPLFLKNKSSASLPILGALALSCHTVGWVAGAQRQVEIWSAPPGTLLRVAGGSDFYISPGGQDILCVDQEQGGEMLNDTDRQILLGPAMVLALALRGMWSLHASAAIFRDKLIVFLGESGQGKSTLAAYLTAAGRPDWRLVADDILPVAMGTTEVEAWSHFPQLKLPMRAQPGPHLPESLPLDLICVLTQADPVSQPRLQPLPPNQAAQMVVSHTAGTRLFEPALLAEHLAFCARVAEQIPVYQLTYPHRKDTLPKVRGFLESLC